MVRVSWFGVLAVAGLSLVLLATAPRSVLADDKALGAESGVYLAAAAPAEGAAEPGKADESRAKMSAKLDPWPNKDGFIAPTLDGPWRYRFALNGWVPTSVKITIDDKSESESTTLGADFILGNLKFIVPIDLQVRKGSFGLYWHTQGLKIDGSTPVGHWP